MAADGRDRVLFGDTAPQVRSAFAQSLPTPQAFPELWFEIPLAGAAWCDFHALTARDGLELDEALVGAMGEASHAAFAWFAAQGESVRQLALSWDTGSRNAIEPALQLLLNYPASEVTCDFLATVGRADAAESYRSFLGRIPDDWFACYTGVFPARPGSGVRVECIPSGELQERYAKDPTALEKHLQCLGMRDAARAIASQCAQLAGLPFHLEFQFDVNEDGQPGCMFGASVRFAHPTSADGYVAFDVNGAAGQLMRQLEARGLADSRWRLLGGLAFAKRVTHDGESCVLYSYPAFVKVRLRNGVPFDAKAYVIAGVE